MIKTHRRIITDLTEGKKKSKQPAIMSKMRAKRPNWYKEMLTSIDKINSEAKRLQEISDELQEVLSVVPDKAVVSSIWLELGDAADTIDDTSNDIRIFLPKQLAKLGLI